MQEIPPCFSLTCPHFDQCTGKNSCHMIHESRSIISNAHFISCPHYLDTVNPSYCISRLTVICKACKILRSDQIIRRITHCLNIQLDRIMVTILPGKYIRFFPAVYIIFILLSLGTLSGVESIAHQFHPDDTYIFRQ